MTPMQIALKEAISQYFQHHPADGNSFALRLERMGIDEKDVAAEIAVALTDAGWTNPNVPEEE